MGDYGPDQVNQLIDAGANQSASIRVNPTSKSGDVWVQHTEFIGNVIATTTAPGAASGFQNLVYPINAAIVQTFPWLSQMANNFTLYKFHGLMFQYKPSSGEFGGTSTALGKVVFATNTDPLARPFLSTVEAENYDYSVSCKPSVGMIHGVETAQSQTAVNMMYTRTTGAPDRDKTFSDYGNFQVITEGIQMAPGATSQIVGELWASYTCQLSRAQLNESLNGGNIQTDCFYGCCLASNMLGNTYIRLPTTAFAAQYKSTGLANTGSPRLTNTLGGELLGLNATSMVYRFPANVVQGTYRLDLVAQLDAASLAQRSWEFTTPVPTDFCSSVLASIVDPGVTVQKSKGPMPVGEKATCASIVINVAAPGAARAQVTITQFAAYTTDQQLFLMVTQLPSVIGTV